MGETPNSAKGVAWNCLLLFSVAFVSTCSSASQQYGSFSSMWGLVALQFELLWNHIASVDGGGGWNFLSGSLWLFLCRQDCFL
jgi:hypothetical protein